jgi:hypothetical protein
VGSLGLHADPDGWLNAGYSVRTLMDSLDGELYDADRTGGAGLSQSWAGPVAEAFTGHWSGVRSRAEDLIAHGRRAAAAMTDFGGKLEDFVKRAADLESYWLSFGLQIGLDGMHFALPWGFEQLSPGHQVSFHQWLSESERDVGAMWSDIKAAVDDVVTVLESLITLFEDLVVVELGVSAGLAGGYLDGYMKNPASFAGDGLSVLTERLVRVTNRGLDHAYDVAVGAGEDASRYGPAAVDDLVNSAVHKANLVHEVGKWGGRALLFAAVGVTLWQTYDTAENKKQGWGDAFEEHAGDWAGLAAGVAIGVALAPVGLPAIGAVVVGGILATGVGDGVQWVVDHNKTTINHAAKDIGHGTVVTAKAVGHGVEDAAGWEAEQTEGLAKFL